MQINDTTNKNGVLQVCESLCKLGDGGITNDATLKAYFINYVNIAIGEVRMAMMEVDKTWKSNDYNYTDLATAPISLVAYQRDYELPVAYTGANMSTLLRVNKVYIEDSNDTRSELRPMQPNDDETDALGTPTAYKFLGKTIFLDVGPNDDFVTKYNKIYVEYQRLDDPFVVGDTTQEPGFLGTYHHLLAFRASALHLLPTNPQLAQLYGQEFLSGKERLKADTARMHGSYGNEMTIESISHR